MELYIGKCYDVDKLNYWMDQSYEMHPDLQYKMSFSQPGAQGTITDIFNPLNLDFEMNLLKSAYESDDIRVVSNRKL